MHCFVQSDENVDVSELNFPWKKAVCLKRENDA